VQPHLTRLVGGRPVRGTRAEDWPSLGIPEAHLRLVREAMWSVVNEEGGTARTSRLPAAMGVQMSGKTGTTQVRRISREQRERGFRVEQLPREWRPHALFVAYAPHDNPIFAVSVVVEHGTSGSGAAAPLARDVLVEAFQRLRPGPHLHPLGEALDLDPQLVNAGLVGMDHLGNAVVGGHAVDERRKFAQPLQLRLTELLHRLPTFRSGEHGTDGHQQDLHQWIPLVALNPRILKRRKMFDEAGRHEKLLRSFLVIMPQPIVIEKVYTRSPCEFPRVGVDGRPFPTILV
jgi:hypothetical protein